MNDFQLWGMRPKSREDTTFEISELEISTILKVRKMMSLLVESLHMQIDSETAYRSTRVGFKLHTYGIQLCIPL